MRSAFSRSWACSTSSRGLVPDARPRSATHRRPIQPNLAQSRADRRPSTPWAPQSNDAHNLPTPTPGRASTIYLSKSVNKRYVFSFFPSFLPPALVPALPRRPTAVQCQVRANQDTCRLRYRARASLACNVSAAARRAACVDRAYCQVAALPSHAHPTPCSRAWLRVCPRSRGAAPPSSRRAPRMRLSPATRAADADARSPCGTARAQHQGTPRRAFLRCAPCAHISRDTQRTGRPACVQGRALEQLRESLARRLGPGLGAWRGLESALRASRQIVARLRRAHRRRPIT
ncbi:hypothetical protein DFH06DRAFT_1464069 [Mycena polygramma]|nr:hypothetical protein DFH06DRAFT_1464069 [Mycena polygramma]